MAPLNAARRNNIPSSEFGLPSSRKYPMPDKSHARNALARVSEQENKGAISGSAAAEVRAKAHRKLNDFHGSMADHHLALHAHHLALSEHQEGQGDATSAALNTGIAGHHLKMAEQHNTAHEHFKELADAEGAPSSAAAASPAVAAVATPKSLDPAQSPGKSTKPAMLMGSAKQLHKAGLITDAHHDRIKKSVSAKPKSKPFGSLAGAGHYMGDVDAANSAGTNS